ncbi:MAG: hypothetical protein LBH40_04570 [Alphaproteobacteria bacterium]|jgi:hypothetical protein|nr:hypothetical protein [Alphaproteobacteria bacterium]
MKSRYKGANKTNKSFLKKILVIIIIIALFAFAEHYVRIDDSRIVQETTNIVVR